MAKKTSNGRIEQIMKNYVDDRMQEHRKETLKPASAGKYHEVSNRHNPTGRWRSKVDKFIVTNVTNATNNVITLSGAINANGRTVYKPQAMTLFISSSLSSSIYVDKIGISGLLNGADTTDPNYFYSSSIDTRHPVKNFVSGTNDKILAMPARMGTPQYTEADLINAGYHTSSADITITLNDKPATNVGRMVVYLYGDTFWAAF